MSAKFKLKPQIIGLKSVWNERLREQGRQTRRTGRTGRTGDRSGDGSDSQTARLHPETPGQWRLTLMDDLRLCCSQSAVLQLLQLFAARRLMVINNKCN